MKKNLLHKVFKFLLDKKYRFCYLNDKGFFKSQSDEKFIKKQFSIMTGYELNIENPQTFNEKMQWLKLFDRKNEYATMVDKFEAKKYVEGKIGSEHIIETYAVWDKIGDINIDNLPDQFVLKCTHDSGGVVICKDKQTFDLASAKKNLEKSINNDYYIYYREWPYKNVKPRIIAEKYMKEISNDGIIDYKFYCFNGVPKFLYISTGMDNHSTAKISFVTLDWNFSEFKRKDYSEFSKLPPKPKKFDEMIEIAKKLSSGHSFLRVDLYEIGGNIYFSELTFFPCGGYMPFKSYEQDLKMGNYLVFNKKEK